MVISRHFRPDHGAPQANRGTSHGPRLLPHLSGLLPHLLTASLGGNGTIKQISQSFWSQSAGHGPSASLEMDGPSTRHGRVYDASMKHKPAALVVGNSEKATTVTTASRAMLIAP